MVNRFKHIEKSLFALQIGSLICFVMYWEAIRDYVGKIDIAALSDTTYAIGAVLIAAVLVLPFVLIPALLIMRLFFRKSLDGPWAMRALAQGVVSAALAVVYFKEITWFLD